MKKGLSFLMVLILLAGICLFAGCAQTGAESSAPMESLPSSGSDPEPASRPELSAESAGPSEEPLPDEIRVLTLKGPTGMGMAKLISDRKNGETDLPYAFTVASAPDQISAEVIKGDFEFAAVPVNLASVLYNKTGGSVLVAAVNTLGVLYVLENGDTVHSVEDLKGKSLTATGQGSTPEYVLNYILSKNGINPEKDLTVSYLAEHAELATQVTAGSVSIGMLPEPNVTSVLLNNADVRIALDLTDEWDKVSDTVLVQGVLIVSKAFAEAHPSAVGTFLNEYAKSVSFAQGNPDEASELIAEAEIIPKAAVAKKALPNCNIVLLSGKESKDAVSAMLKVLYEANPASVGGNLPGDDFYYLG
ncbi:MAG: ABC transporter substrate-binding protein [Clostridia bacterium]|nr:ABC transporter substrate-binding protein [Clostridia bacterium]